MAIEQRKLGRTGISERGWDAPRLTDATLRRR
jgi:hypothetical protein